MAADPIDALLGLDIREEDQIRALAKQLRGERNDARIFASSTREGLRDQGIRELKNARGTAERVGTRIYDREKERTRIGERETTDTRLNQARKEASAKHKLEMRKRGKLESFTDPANDNAQINLQQRPDGTYVNSQNQVVDTAGLVPYDKYQARVNFGAPKKDLYGIQMRQTPQGATFLDGMPYSQDESKRRAIEGGLLTATQARNKEQSKALGKGFGTEVIETIEGLESANASMGTAQTRYDEVFNAIDAGAFSGPGWDYTPTLREATVQLESAAAGLALDELTKYKLAPVSDKDIQYVKSAAMPNLYGESLQRWVTHKKEATERMVAANQLVIDTLRETGEIGYGESRKVLEAQIEQILHGDGFEFAFDLNAESPGIADGGKPEYITQEEWDSFSDEQKAQL